MTTKENYLFLFGVLNESFNPVALRYDVVNNNWTDLKIPPFQAWIGSAAALCKDNIYLIGGMNVTKDLTALDQSHFTSNNHMYSIQSNSWTKLNNLPKKTAYHAVVSHNDLIYCGGGYQMEASPNLYAYDIHDQFWRHQ